MQQSAWTYLDENLIGFTDITFYGGLAYAVGRLGMVVSFDVNSNNYSSSQLLRPNIIVPGGCHTTFRYAERVYIVMKHGCISGFGCGCKCRTW